MAPIIKGNGCIPSSQRSIGDSLIGRQQIQSVLASRSDEGYNGEGFAGKRGSLLQTLMGLKEGDGGQKRSHCQHHPSNS